jgi:Protein of unknown function (DUF2849)
MMSQQKRPPLPVLLLANDLLDGDVVFWTGTAWSLNPTEAFIAQEENAAIVLETIGHREFLNNQVVDHALVDVTLDDHGRAIPNHFRERFKISGPSVRLDLGKQAVYKRA